MTTTVASEVTPAGFRLPGAASYTGLSEEFIRKLTRENRVRSVKIGRARIYPKTALDELLSNSDV